MMVERHYDEETLLALIDKASLGSDAHLDVCAVCSEKLSGFRTITQILHEHDVWETAAVRADPLPGTIANLRMFADRMAFEDTAADAILPGLLAGPREEWMPRLTAHPQWRTAGVVRRLVRTAMHVVMSMPPDALAMTAMAIEIADHLDPRSYRTDTIAKLSGAAWRDHAYALFYVGRFADALDATEKASLAIRGCVVDEYDRARIAVIRALCLRAAEELPDAVAAVRFSSETFGEFGDLPRRASARLAETHLLFTKGEYTTALEILNTLEHQLRDAGDVNLYARVLGNLGYCLWKLGRVDEALQHHDASATLLADIGVHTEAVRVRWNVASILAAEGRVDEAHARFEALKASFDEMGMASESALVSLDLAEVMVARADFDSVQALCRAAMSSFERSGIPYTARALTALAYIREAAQQRRVTPAVVKHVREYLRRLPEEGQLLFAPPPPEAFARRSR